MITKIGVGIVALALALYLVFAGQRAVIMLTSGEPVGIAMGIALVVLPAVGAWALVRELLFGGAASRLGKRLESEGGLPPEEVHVKPSGRVEREDADALFPKYRAEVEAAPDDWRTWYRLGLVYDAAGDRRRAREAVRKAIALSRAAAA